MFGKAIQTDADVSTACYGGPLVDVRGRVLGLLVPMAPQSASDVAGAEWYDSGIGFAVPLEPLAETIERMKKGEDQRPGLLGIGMAGRNPHSAAAKLAAVRPDSPAGKAGLKKGDRIVEVDGRPIKTQTDLRFALGPRYAGESIRLVAKRGDESLERTVELIGELPPFRHAFLGILPMRKSNEAETDDDANDKDDPSGESAKSPKGIAVRMVYEGSPAAEGGLQPGDRIERIDETDVKSINDAIGAMNNLGPGNEVKLTLTRDGETKEVTIVAARIPTNVPTELPSAHADVPPPAADETAEAKSGETTDLKLPEFPNKCKVYVPAMHDPDRPLGVLLWLHARGEQDGEEVIGQWKPICNRDGLRWERTELEYLNKLTVRIISDYKIDPRRVVVFGQEGGGAMAWLMGLSGRNVFRGIATSAARLPRQATVPPNDQAQRLAIWAAVPGKKDGAGQITQGLQKVAEAGYPVTSISIADKSGELKEPQREELARWIDVLDRF
jgi:serine protease Do